MRKRSKLITTALVALIAAFALAYIGGGCGSGVDFGVRKFTLTGAGQ